MISAKIAELFVDMVAKDGIRPALSKVRADLTTTQWWLNNLSMSSPRLMNDFARVQQKLAKTKTLMSLGGVRAETDYLRTDQGKAGVRDQVAAQDKLTAAQKQLAREFDRASLGKFGVVMKDLKGAVGGFKESLEKLGGGGAGGVLGPIIGGLGAFAAIAAASPDHMATLTGSINYLAGSIGRIFLPVVIDICRWLQAAARWIQSLDAATVANIATAAKWAVGFIAVAGAIRLVSLALASMMAINPWLLALAGLASLAALGGLFGEGIRDSMRGALGADSLLGAAGPGMARGGALSFSGLLAAPGIAGRAGEAVGTGVAGEGVGSTVGRAVGSSLLTSNPAYWAGLAGSAAISAVGDAIGSARHLMGGSEAAGGAASDVSIGLRAASPSIGLRAASGLPGAPGAAEPDLLLGRNFQSQFFGIEEQWKRLQQAGASLSPLDSEMMRFAVDGRTALLSIAESTGITARREPTVGGMSR